VTPEMCIEALLGTADRILDADQIAFAARSQTKSLLIAAAGAITDLVDFIKELETSMGHPTADDEPNSFTNQGLVGATEGKTSSRYTIVDDPVRFTPTAKRTITLTIDVPETGWLRLIENIDSELQQSIDTTWRWSLP
jgi:hypothetical protein